MIRIVGGCFRGRCLQVPPVGTRPTSNRLREAIFNILLHDRVLDVNFDTCDVLDAFSGSGALGFEALSRGARSVSFVENNNEALRILEINSKNLQTNPKTKIYNTSAIHPIISSKQHDLIFIDPPYYKNLAWRSLEALSDAGWIAPNARVIIETERYKDLLGGITIPNLGWRAHRIYELNESLIQIGWIENLKLSDQT